VCSLGAFGGVFVALGSCVGFRAKVAHGIELQATLVFAQINARKRRFIESWAMWCFELSASLLLCGERW
jgi:hypothetical protein